MKHRLKTSMETATDRERERKRERERGKCCCIGGADTQQRRPATNLPLSL